MTKYVLNVLKLFIIHAKESNIHELDINELRENFYQFSKMEKYQSILNSYKFDENGICLNFESELKKLIFNKQVTLHKNLLYIYTIDTKMEEHFSDEINHLVRQMVTDYITMNMNRQKVKMG